MAPATLLHHLRRLTASPSCDGQPDRELLRRFTREGDDRAFAAVLRRHGPMVWSACRRVVERIDDAEDVFQATFLLLMRKAGTLRDQNSVGSWLYGVAHRLALRTRSNENLRHVRERSVPSRSVSDPLAEISLRETQQLFDMALSQLPGKYRAVLVLCYLEGLTQEEAARQLGCSRSTLKRYLEAGRSRLRERLLRHGLTLSAALLAASLTSSTSAAVPANLTAAVLCAASGGTVVGRVVRLAAQGNGTLLTGTRKIGACLLLAAVTAIAGTAGLAACWMAGAPADELGSTVTRPDDKPQPPVDRLDDPLPDRALARIGTTRLRHGQTIQCLAFAADGKRLRSYGADGISVWDAGTGREEHHLLPEPGSRFLHAAFSPDGKRVAATSLPESGVLVATPITLIDLATGKKVGELGKALYFQVCFAPQGGLLAAARFDQVVEVWDVAAGKQLASWRAHEGKYRAPSLAFTRDGKTLMTASTDQTVCFWEAATGKRLRKLTGITNTDDSLALSPDGKHLASVETVPPPARVIGGEITRSRVRILDTDDGRELRRVEVPARKLPFNQANAVRQVALSSDGNTLAGVASDNWVYLWDMTTGKEVGRVKTFAPSAVAFSPDGKSLAVGTWGNAIHVYDVASGKELPRGTGLERPARFVGLTPDGKTLATPEGMGSLALWDTATGQLRRRLEGHEGLVTSMLLSADGRTLFSAGVDGTVRVWDMETGRQRRRIVLDDSGACPGPDVLACTSDGKQIVVHAPPSNGVPLQLIDATTGQGIRQIDPGSAVVHGASFLPDGRSLVVWTGDRKARLWDAATGKTTRQVEYPEAVSSRPGPVPVVAGGEASFFNAAVSSDGRLIAFGSAQDLIAIHELDGGAELCRKEHLTRGVGCLAFSPDGRTLAWGNQTDPLVHLLEVATGKERATFAGHRGGVVTLVFAANGKTLISSGTDTTLLVWDLMGREGNPGILAADELNESWQELLGDDAARAHRAIRKLAAAPASTVGLFRDRIKPVAPVEEQVVAQLIARLDSDEFAVRQKAAAELERLGDRASGAGRKALAAQPSAETRRQLEQLLEKQAVQTRQLPAERVRLARALEVLEFVRTEAARQLLTVLAQGAPGAWLTEEAQRVLTRLTARGGKF